MSTRKKSVRTLIKASLAFATMSLLTGCIVVASTGNADIHHKKELTLTASGLKTLDIEAGAGGLIIQGSELATDITVSADIYTSSKSNSEYEFDLSDSGVTAFLVAKTSSSGMWMGNSPRIDLVITVPTKMMLEINDGSGAINISNINGAINVIDGSGEISLSNIMGNVAIDDGSGEINLSDIDGDLSIEDGSGSIYARGVSGNANINDGSGDLTVKQVKGSITLEDGSGDINIEEAGGLKIIDSGSGGLKVSNIKGGFEIDS
jgi:hypothetical protein